MRSRKNKIGITVCLALLLAMLLSVLIPVGCTYDDTGFVFANGSIFVMELAGSPRSEGFGNDPLWLGIRFWQATMQGGVPSLRASGYLTIPWVLSVLILGGVLRILWRDPRTRDGLSFLCRQCGYNLTGNVSGVCPECGTSVR